MRQPRPDDDQRQPQLADLVAGCAQRRQVVGPQVLHLVDADRHAHALVGGQASDVGEQLDEVDLDVSRIRAAGGRGYLDAGVPAFGQFGAGARVAFDERTDRAQRRVRVRMSQLAHRGVQGGPHRTPDSLIRTRLEFAGAPARAHRSRSQRIQQHRLADPAQAGEDHRPFGSAACDSFEHDIEGVQLLVASGEFGGTLTGARGVGVADRVHARTLFGCLVLMEEARISGSKSSFLDPAIASSRSL